ncbi:MAG: cytidine deaminase [Desulfobacteraceae bacterium]|nr:cytidine deaminase [Desulfobacteraceae bacterium]
MHNKAHRTDLMQAAQKAALKAYAPYSNYRVGSAVETDIGIFTGANVENACNNLGICAERVALANAVASGASTIYAVAVCCLDATKDNNGHFFKEETMPCGACRQWLAELAPEAVIYTNASPKGMGLDELLPNAFRIPGS